MQFNGWGFERLLRADEDGYLTEHVITLGVSRLRPPRSGLRTMTTAAFQKVQINRGNGEQSTFDAYIVGDEGAPGVVVLQEWWGADYEVKNHAITIAKKGFRSLIPDLYRGKVGLDAAEAQHLMDSLDWPGAVKDVEASVKWPKEHGSKKVGVTGFCMGGALSLAAGVLVPGVDAVVAIYGTPSPELADTSKMKVPVQAHFGELDQFAGFADVGAAKTLEKNLEAAVVDSEVYIYPNNGHAFMNSSEEAVKPAALLNTTLTPWTKLGHALRHGFPNTLNS